MTALLKLVEMTENLVLRICRAGSLLLLVLIAVIIFDVATRGDTPVARMLEGTWLRQHLSSTKLQEWEWHLHGVILFTALGAAYLRGAHVRIDMLRSRLSIRTRAWVEIVGILVLMLPFLVTVLYFSWFFVLRAWTTGEGSPSMAGLNHRWLIKAFLPLSFMLCILAALSILVRLVALLRCGGKPDTRLAPLLAADDRPEPSEGAA